MGSVWSWLSADEEDDGGETLLSLLENINDAPNPEMTWTAIIARLRSQPHEAAAYCHFSDASPLMRSLQRRSSSSPPSLAVVRAFLDAYSDSAFHTDRNGVTPLAAYLYSLASAAESLPSSQERLPEETEDLKIVEELVQANQAACWQPDAQERVPMHWVRNNPSLAEYLIEQSKRSQRSVDHVDSTGCLPLHYACQMRLPPPQEGQEASLLPLPRICLLDTLIKSSQLPHGGVLTKDQSGKRPLDLVYMEIQELERSKNDLSLDTGNTGDNTSDQRIESLLDIMEFLVKVAVETATTYSSPEDQSLRKGSPKDDQSFLLVHSILLLGRCPSLVLKAALQRYPEQAATRDSARRTPLALAANQATPSSVDILLELIRSYPAAARMTDPDGRLPIDVIAEKGVYHEELFEALVQAEPRAVDTRDLKYKQHPFLTAALAGENANVASVYHLLRAKPHVIAYYNLS